MSVHRSAVLALAMAGAMSAGAAFAGDRQLPEACKADVSSLCPGMTPGDGKIRKCMKEHRDKVSEGCRSAIKQAKAGHESRHGAGHASSGVPDGGGRGDGEGPNDE
jgi:hypothetical protein